MLAESADRTMRLGSRAKASLSRPSRVATCLRTWDWCVANPMRQTRGFAKAAPLPVRLGRSVGSQRTPPLHRRRLL